MYAHAKLLPRRHAFPSPYLTRASSSHTCPLAPAPVRPAVTGQTMYVDNGLSIMGLALDSKTLERNSA
jgi:hypothetical protein